MITLSTKVSGEPGPGHSEHLVTVLYDPVSVPQLIGDRPPKLTDDRACRLPIDSHVAAQGDALGAPNHVVELVNQRRELHHPRGSAAIGRVLPHTGRAQRFVREPRWVADEGSKLSST